jgi:Domain of unknown function (DUF4340)
LTHRRRQLVTNVFWVVLALVATTLVALTSKTPTSAEQLARSHHLLSVFRPEDVSRVTLEKAGQRYVMGRTAAAGQAPEAEPRARWQWLEPFQGDAEETAVDQLLRSVEFATWLRQLPDADVDRAALGLDSPSCVVSVDMGEVRWRVRVANAVPGGNGARYVEVTGEGTPNKGVFVVSESTAKDLDPNPEDLRIRQLIPYSGAALQRISALRGEQRVELVRSGRQEFRFEGAWAGARVGREALDRVLLAFARTDMQHFVPDDQAQATQAAAQSQVLQLRLVPREATAATAVVFIGGDCPMDSKLVLARRSEPRPTAGCIAKTDLASAFDAPQALVDRALFQTRLDETERVTIVAGERRLELVRAGDAFEMRSPAQGAVEKDAGEQRVSQIVSARGVVEPVGDVTTGLERFGLAPPAATVTIEEASAEPDGERESIELGTPVTMNGTDARVSYYARRASDGLVLRIGAGTREAFSVDALLLRARQLWELTSAEVREVKVEVAGRRSRLTQVAAGGFALEVTDGTTAAPVQYAADASLAVEWLEAVRQLRAVRWVSEIDDGRFGFDRPRLSFWVTDSAVSRQVIVGAVAPQGYFAKLANADGVFVLARNVVATLETLILDRSVFMLDPERLGELTVRHSGREFTWHRLGRELEQEPGDLELPPAAVEALVEALSLVRPEAAITLDGPRAAHGLAEPLLEVRFSSEDVAVPVRRWSVGARGIHQNQAVYYARLQGQSAVYVIAAPLIDAIVNQL